MRTLRAALAVGATVVMVTAGLLVGPGSPAGAVELVANPGFESGTAGWTCTAETGIGTPAHAGAAALVGTPTGTTAECGQTIPVTAGAAYTLTAWVRGAFVFLGASGTATGDVSIWTPGTNGAFEQLTVRFTGGSTPVRIWVHGWYAQGTYQADDVSLQGPGSAPPPPPPPPPPPTTAPPTTAPPTSPPPPSPTNPPGTGVLPRHTLTGYWHNFVNGSSALRLRDVPATYDVVDIAFASATATPGAVSFTVDPQLSSALGGYTDANLAADVGTLHARGARVVLSVGGELGTVSVNDAAGANAFATSVRSIMTRFGFDGVDIDLENGVNPTFMAQALHQLAAASGSGFILTLAPQTIDCSQPAGRTSSSRSRSGTSSPRCTRSTTTPARCSAATARCMHRARSTSSPHLPASSCRAGCGRTRSRSACPPPAGRRAAERSRRPWSPLR